MWQMLTVLLCGTAAWQAGECWRDGSIFAGPRKWFRRRGGFFGQLLGCPYCLAHWTALALTAGAMPAWAEGREWFWLPVLWLCAVRVATLGLGRVGNPYAPAEGLEEAADELDGLTDKQEGAWTNSSG